LDMKDSSVSEKKTKYCPYCGTQIEYRYTSCPSCGKIQPLIDGVEKAPQLQKKNPLIAVVLSLLLTGMGQIYLGYIRRGLLFLGSILLLGVLLQQYMTFEDLMIVGLIFQIFSAWDAYRLAKAINKVT
jgi:TM2 domain-containing membrane protein YozV